MVFRGALGVPNFFVTSLCARNCIPAKKSLAILKTAELEFFRIFGANKSRLGVFRDALGVPNFL